MGSKLLNLRTDAYKRRYASGADHGQNSTRTVERNTKRHVGLASVANGLCREE